MLKPEQVIKLMKEKPYGGDPLEEARFIRIAFFDTPDDPRVYNGLAAQLAGNDMYGSFVLLKTLEVAPGHEEYYKENAFTGAAEWEWNGGEDLEGEQLEEAKKLYNTLLLSKINEEITRLSEELEETKEECKLGHISYDALDNISYSIQCKAQDLWTNQYPGSRFPEWFEDLKVPGNMKDMFNDIFGDFSV